MDNRSFLIRFFGFALTTAIIVLLVSCSSENKQEEEVLARVGQFDITRQHYLNELRRFYDRTGQAVNLGSDVKENVLNARVNRYAIVEFAYYNGWDKEPEAEHMKAMIQRKVNMEEYERRFIHENVEITENDLRELFFRANTSIRASHLFAPNRHVADSLFALLESGVSFETLARSVFRNPELAASGGDLGYFTIDDMDISFEDKAYRMDIGDISRPVKTSQGFSIIKVTDIVTTPVITETEFANIRNQIAEIARKQQFELATRQHMQQTIDSFEFDEQLIQQIWDAVKRNPDAYFSFNDEASMITLDLPADVYNLPLAQRDGFTFTVLDFLQESYFSSIQQRQQARDTHTFREQLAGTAFRAYALSKVESHPRFDRHLVNRTVEETFFNYLHQQFETYLDSLVEIPEQMIMMEFMKNRDLYVEPIQLNMAEIVVTSEQAADQVMNLLNSGANFNTVLQRYTADPAGRSTNGELGFMPVDRFGMMAPSLSAIQPGEIAGPFQIMSNRFLIFKCLDRIESRQLSFEEAQPLVKRSLHLSYKEELRRIKIDEARTMFNATIFTERLHAIPIQL
jgi:foldase protein PrsA